TSMNATKKPSSVTLVAGMRGRDRIAYEARKRIASTSAIPTEPATFQCTFSNVQQKIVARKRKLVTFLMPQPRLSASAGSCEPLQQRCELLDARAPRETAPPFVGERRAVERSRAPAVAQVGERTLDSVDVVRGDDDAGAGLLEEPGGRAVRRDDGEDRALGGQVLEHLAGEHAAPAATCLRDEQEERLRVALERQRATARHVRDQLEPAGQAETV